MDYTGQYNGIINGYYNKLFGRSAKDDGLNFWGNSLLNPDSGINFGNLEQSLINGATGDDLEYYNNKFPQNTASEVIETVNPVNPVDNTPQGPADTVTPNMPDTSSWVDIFQPNLYPRSESRSTNRASNTSESSGSGYSGLDYNNSFVQGILSRIDAATKNLPGQIDEYTRNAADAAEASARSTMQNIVPGILEALASRGILTGSISDEAFEGAMESVAENAAARNYDAGMRGAEMKMSIPTILGQLAELGKMSKSETSSSSQGSSTGESNSYNVNPLAPYELIANILLQAAG